VPVKVGLAESTMFPVPVTAFESVIPPYVRALVRVSAPFVANDEVAVAPKYAGPYELKRVVDAPDWNCWSAVKVVAVPGAT